MNGHTIYSNGEQLNTFSYYFGGDSIVKIDPLEKIVENTYPRMLYVDIDYSFDKIYSYNNYRAVLLDGLIKVCTILVYFILAWALLCQFVKYVFTKELHTMIVRTEREVEQEGAKALNLNQSCDRFHEQLSFRTIYKNQFKI